MTEDTTEDVMSLEEVLARLDVSRARFYDVELHKMLPRVKKEGRWYYSAGAVEKVAQALAQYRDAVSTGELPPSSSF